MLLEPENPGALAVGQDARMVSSQESIFFSHNFSPSLDLVHSLIVTRSEIGWELCQ